MTVGQEVKSKFKELQQLVSKEPCDVSKCRQTVNQLKLYISDFSSLSPISDDFDKEEILLARTTYEISAKLCVESDDISGFVRNVAVLRTLYRDYSNIPQSEDQYAILGAFLLHLLSIDEIGPFHTELESWPMSERQKSSCVSFSVRLEESIMEGNYSRILESCKQTPLPYYKCFLKRLLSSVEDRLASCLEKSCKNLKKKDAIKMLAMSNVKELEDLVKRMNNKNASAEDEEADIIKWSLEDDSLHFIEVRKKAISEIPALKVIQSAVGYATELERIV
eukprot:GHVL01010881.1.p1 GENE.GHVL01010881.1~~GHVL01010881.1.p1  ORF type:complete len:279 (+),score=75.73 GHVL01010881.1:48-884(+)